MDGAGPEEAIHGKFLRAGCGQEERRSIMLANRPILIIYQWDLKRFDVWACLVALVQYMYVLLMLPQFGPCFLEQCFARGAGMARAVDVA